MYGPYGGTPAAAGHVRIGFMPTIIQLSSGAAWMLFISLASGLLFAILGGLVGGNRDMVENLTDRDEKSTANCPPGTTLVR